MSCRLSTSNKSRFVPTALIQAEVGVMGPEFLVLIKAFHLRLSPDQ